MTIAVLDARRRVVERGLREGDWRCRKKKEKRSAKAASCSAHGRVFGVCGGGWGRRRTLGSWESMDHHDERVTPVVVQLKETMEYQKTLHLPEQFEMTYKADIPTAGK